MQAPLLAPSRNYATSWARTVGGPRRRETELLGAPAELLPAQRRPLQPQGLDLTVLEFDGAGLTGHLFGEVSDQYLEGVEVVGKGSVRYRHAEMY